MFQTLVAPTVLCSPGKVENDIKLLLAIPLNKKGKSDKFEKP